MPTGRLLVLFTALAGVTLGTPACVPAPSRPLGALAPAERATLDRKLSRLATERYGDPDLAEQFYVNSRTGPIITRGPDATTGTRALSPEAYLPALQQMRAMPRYSTGSNAVLPSFDEDPGLTAAPGAALGTWANIGPANQGGRTRALLIHPTTPSILYAGGVAGGVWKSTDGGSSWATTTDLQMANLAVVSLAFDPVDANIIYAGTGEGFGNADGVRGAGIFKSADAGTTWTRMASTNNASFYYTMDLVVSTRSSLRIFAATSTGVFRLNDGGASWSNLIAVPAGGCTDLALQRNGAGGYVFAACGTLAGTGSVYRALDNGTSTFTSILAVTGQGRSSLAVAPSAENVLYVMSAQRTNGGGYGQYALRGIFRSNASGDAGTFTTQVDGTTPSATIGEKLSKVLLTNPIIALATECNQGTSQSFNQGWYDNVIAVDPADPNRVWAGGIDLFRSDDGGLSWGAASYWWKTKGTDPRYHHADQHGIVFHPQYNGTSNTVMFSASDGGIDRIDNARAPVNTTLAQICGTPLANGPTWIDRNNGYVTTQFFDGVVYPDAQAYFGGLQDNGTQRGTASSQSWAVLAGGDGGHVAVDTLGDANPANDVLFLENTGNSIRKSTNGGATFSAGNSGISGTGFLFITPFIMNDAFRQQLWTGGHEIWRTTNQAGSWSRATGVNQTCGGGSVSAIAAHPLDPNRVIVGMSDGCYHYNHAALAAPNTGLWPGGGFIASGYISWVAWDPTNINIAYATVSRFGGTNLLKSVNGGATWTSSVGTGTMALPQIPALTVAVNPADSQQVFVGTDLGVFTSVDGGASWFVENTGFANTPVEALRVTDRAPYQVFAFTHGRGAWRVPTAGGGGGGGPVLPQPPVNFRVTGISGNTVTFGWLPPASGAAPAGYQLEGGLAPGQVVGTLPLGPAPSVTIALPSGAFYMRVRTLSGGVASAPSNEVLAHVNVATPPSPPSNLLGLVVGNNLSLIWNNTLAGGAPTTVILDVSGAVSG